VNKGLDRGVAHGAMIPTKFFKYPVILCFERRCPKQNTFAILKSNILPPSIFLDPPEMLV